MYRSAPRYESRSSAEKPSRSARSTWVEPQQNRPYAPLLEEDDRGLLSEPPYLAEDAHVLDARDYQYKGTSSGTDLREAQRLAANFFSQYPSASTAPEPLYRDAPRFGRPVSPEVSIDRYPPRGQYRDRDVGIDRWGGRPNPETFPSSRSQLLLEDWEEERVPVDMRRDLYGFPTVRERKRDDAAWDDNEYDYGVARKDADFAPIQTTSELDGGGLRVTKRLDWTGLFRPDEGSTVLVEDGLSLDLPLNKRASSQSYAGIGRPLADSYRAGVQDELNADGSAYSRRGAGYYGTERYRDVDVRREARGNIGERLPERDEYLIGRSIGIRGGERVGRGQEDWRMDRETSAGQVHRVLDSDRGKNKRRFDDRDSRRPFDSSGMHAGSGSGTHQERDFPEDNTQFGNVRGGKYGAKRDFSQRASITNRDILAVYYGNQGPRRQANNFAPTRGHPYSGPSRHYTQPSSERYRPQRSSHSPSRGRPGWQNFDNDPAQKGNKRWEKPAVAVQGKRFKRETQSDKLYLMHNNKAKSEEKEEEAAVSLSVAEGEALDTKEGNSKGEASEPAVEDFPKVTSTAVEGKDPLEPSNNLWDNEDSWSDSEDEEKQTQVTWDGPPTNDASARGKDGDQPTSEALQPGDVNDSKNLLCECSEDDEDDDADWESLASDLDDQLDDVCVHQGLEADNAMTENPQSEGIVTSTPERKASEESGRVGTLSVAQSQDSEMVDIDNFERREEGNKDVAEVDSSSKEGSVGIEKKTVVVIMEELQESVKNREDKAFDNYVSLFEHDTDLRKLYEANVNSGSFECLVCAGIGAKKKKRFPDVASLVQHAKKILRTKKLPEHRGFARAVCKILGWETVPGPSIILPRGGVPREESEPMALTVAAPKNQEGAGEQSVGWDWEWAAARQLFEEQEARIDGTTKSSGELLQTDNSTTCWSPSSKDGKNPDISQGLDGDGLVTVVEQTRMLEQPMSVDVISVPEKASVKAVTVPGKACLVELNSEPAKNSNLTALSVKMAAAAETTSVCKKSEVSQIMPDLELLTVIGVTGVPDNSVGEPLSVTESSTALSLAYEITTVVPDLENDLAPSSSETDTGAESVEVEMWGPLPPEEIAEDKPSRITVVETQIVYESTREAPPAAGSIAAPLSAEASVGNGVGFSVGESPGDRTDENGEAVLHAQGSSALVVVPKISHSEVDPGLPANTVTGVVDGDSSAKTASEALQGEQKEAGFPLQLPEIEVDKRC